MDGYRKRTLKKREAIIQAGERLFTSNGVDRTKMKDIAREASVSPVTIYNYFGSKQRVLYEVLRRQFEAMTKTFENIVYDSSKAFKEKLEELLMFEFELVDSLPDDLLDAFYAPGDEEMERLIEWYSENRTTVGLQHLIREGKKEGAVAPSMSETSVMTYIELFKNVRKLPAARDKATLKDLMHMFFYGLNGKR